MSSLGIGDFTMGIDSSGMSTYKEQLKLDILDETIKRIDEISSITTAVDAAWQGAAKQRFMDLFAKAREKVKEDLQAEYDNLTHRLDELQTQYYETDMNIIPEGGE